MQDQQTNQVRIRPSMCPDCLQPMQVQHVGGGQELPHAPPCDVRMRMRPCQRPPCRQEHVGYFADAGSLTFVVLPLVVA
jgi:hypothetical protein